MKRNLDLHLERLSWISQVISAVAVVISLVYVGLQLHDNTAAIQRSEENATQSQWSAIRFALSTDREVAQLFHNGLTGTVALDEADHMRFGYLMDEYKWATYQIWDREQRGLLEKGNFARNGGRNLARLICQPGGQRWWATTRTHMKSGFSQSVDEAVASLSEADKAECTTQAAPRPAKP